jgi:hypothetical protein
MHLFAARITYIPFSGCIPLFYPSSNKQDLTVSLQAFSNANHKSPRRKRHFFNRIAVLDGLSSVASSSYVLAKSLQIDSGLRSIPCASREPSGSLALYSRNIPEPSHPRWESSSRSLCVKTLPRDDPSSQFYLYLKTAKIMQN